MGCHTDGRRIRTLAGRFLRPAGIRRLRRGVTTARKTTGGSGNIAAGPIGSPGPKPFVSWTARCCATALWRLIEALGSDWRFMASDVTEGDVGTGERLTFIYDIDRVQPSGLVGELVRPDTVDQSAKQFARSPYAVSFARGEVSSS